MPATIRFGLPLALLVAVVVFGWGQLAGVRSELRIVSNEDQLLSEAHVELFRNEPSSDSPSPSVEIGDIDCPLGTLSLGIDELGGSSALARVTAPGYGVGFILLEQGQNELVLGEPVSVHGRIHAPAAFLAGARVQAFGGGARGVLLLETRSDAHGGFVLDGISSEIAFVLVRVFQSGFAVAELDWEVGGDTPLELTLVSTQLLSGSIEFCSGYAPQSVEVRAYQVPGVQTTSDAEGHFRIDNLPPEPIRTALLLSSLPEEFTHRRIQISVAEKEVRIPIQRSAIVRGRVINGNSGEGVPGAKVLHDHGPRGREVVECSADGSFEIGRLPSGEVRLDADIMVEVFAIPGDPSSPKRHRLVQGHVDLDLIEGETIDSVVITIY